MAETGARRMVIGVIAVLVLVVAIALALGGGGHHSSGESGGAASATSEGPNFAGSVNSGEVRRGARHRNGLRPGDGSATNAPAATHGVPANGAAVATSADDSLTATRVVKTGSLSLTVPRGEVNASVSKLVALATRLGGYVSSSRTDSVDGSPSGEVTLRVPVDTFDAAVAGAAALGRQTSLTTTAQDVTGHYVDLAARESALVRTRSTYLTILGQAKTIGATLEVQQRIDGVQQQIEELQGQLKVLDNQSSYATLSVTVSQTGAAVATPVRAETGIGAAWHRSVHRFTRGIDAIIGILGPLLLALLILGALAVIGWLSYRAIRRYSVPAGTRSGS